MFSSISKSIVGFLNREGFSDLKNYLLSLDNAALSAEELAWRDYGFGFSAWGLGQPVTPHIAILKQKLEDGDAFSGEIRARIKMLLGVLHDELQESDRTIAYYQSALSDFIRDGNVPRTVAVLVNLANINIRINDQLTAISYARQAIQLAEKSGLTKTHPYAYAWNATGIAASNLQNFDTAVQAYEKMTEVGKTIGNERVIAIASHNLAELHLERNNVDHARQCYEQAYEPLLKHNPALAADSLSGLGKIAMLEGDLPAAQAYFDHAQSQMQATHNVYITTDLHLARAALAEKMGDPAAALRETRAATESVETLRANISLPDDRARFSATRASAYDHLISRLIAASQLDEAFYAAEQAKSRTLLELLQQRGAGQKPIRPPRHVPPAWLDEETALRAQLAQAYGAGAANVPALERDLDAVRERIRIADAEFGSFQAANPIHLEEARARLPNGACLIEYFVAEPMDSGSVVTSTYSDLREVWAFVLTRQNARAVKLALSPAQLRGAFRAAGDGAVRRLPHLLPDGSGRLNPPVILPQLKKFLLEPLGDEVARADLVCIVPHGVLHYVPFHALLPDQPVLYAPGATVLLDLIARKPATSSTGAVALGVNFADPARPLAYAETEAALVANLLGGHALVGSRAARANFITQARGKKYVHLACHANFRPEHPMQSYLQFSDGALDAQDVLHSLELDAELVTLSGCDTGLSQIMRGDELIGFTRAFLYAGAPSALVSQWVVNDLSTCILMKQFYARLGAFGDGALPPAAKAIALQKACRALANLTAREIHDELLGFGLGAGEADSHLRALAGALGARLTPQTRLFDHPFYHAPFFLVGDRLPA